MHPIIPQNKSLLIGSNYLLDISTNSLNDIMNKKEVSSSWAAFYSKKNENAFFAAVRIIAPIGAPISAVNRAMRPKIWLNIRSAAKRLFHFSKKEVRNVMSRMKNACYEFESFLFSWGTFPAITSVMKNVKGQLNANLKIQFRLIKKEERQVRVIQTISTVLNIFWRNSNLIESAITELPGCIWRIFLA